MNPALNEISFDPELSPGARNAVQVCLKINPCEKVTVMTDNVSKEIAASIVNELESMGSNYRAWVLEELAARPLQSIPREIVEDLETSQVSVFAARALPNELRSRMQMTEIITRRKIRHAHMVNINAQIMREGMRADFVKVDKISTRVREIVSSARTINAKTQAGTDLSAELNESYHWIKTSGIISPNKWSNLPGGEVFTTPEQVNGTFVVDGVVGDYLCDKFGDLRDEPLTIRVQRNRLKEAYSANHQLEEEFWRYTHTDENSDRVGEFAIGTNIEIRNVIGHILQDEKIPGVHIAFGNPYAEQWYSSTHIDVVGRRFDIWADDCQIMRAGEFLLEI